MVTLTLTIQAVVAATLTVLIGWYYAWLIKNKNPFSMSDTYKSVVVGVIIKDLPGTILAIVWLTAWDVSMIKALIIASLPWWGSLLAGGWQIVYQVKKATEDIEYYNNHKKD